MSKKAPSSEKADSDKPPCAATLTGRRAATTGVTPSRRQVSDSVASTVFGVSLTTCTSSPLTPSSDRTSLSGAKARFIACQTDFGLPVESTAPQPGPGLRSFQKNISAPAVGEPGLRHSSIVRSTTSAVVARDRSR